MYIPRSARFWIQNPTRQKSQGAAMTFCPTFVVLKGAVQEGRLRENYNDGSAWKTCLNKMILVVCEITPNEHQGRIHSTKCYL